MPAQILDGRKRAQEIKQALADEIGSLKKTFNKAPKLAVLRTTEDPASSSYINSQKKTAEEIGIEYELVDIERTRSENTLIFTIGDLNLQDSVSSVIVMRPIPKDFDVQKIYSAISPFKDAEGLHVENTGRIFFKDYRIVPPTAAAVMELIKLSDIELYGKEAVVISHSNIVGKPLSILLVNEMATVSVCHIATSEANKLKAYVNKAEVLVVAAGEPNLVKGEWIREGAVVIDVGISKVGDSIVGDVEFESASQKASYITPVPGGVGPLTTAMLMRNCLNCFKLGRGIG
ncbi:MAG: bifunctional 5,10-methylenetetrahydrofolate dehydrogenase/5,10-methenyltetrahydrofolate cyclohydrolase [Candidatus Omnitrophica bacterium]|nr:bifunctional 5,10-methylenetetrahydrofolate dehydrogenase/5,10-methenyltetrahydrofolate cyclohydrolase [Candidatus Omnitrophota bacterium]